ncbi:SDR family oxidoreductase [Rhodococcus sp. USK10]|uniref:SDR family NAD(P)-dependent oxidoreductase n=1 Tax=Rhodococcus sp. USK10 TaxID=2789739 RepID=UPI001C5DD55F|nr:SDR family oxidoreductase [Rhodococcus sp. USK10]QYB07140.1 SDR family oxidoreductase [Rhodococcus sp. USK10]
MTTVSTKDDVRQSYGRRLEGRIAAVVGAGSGMGRAIALRFAAEGAHVVVADRDLDAARLTHEAILAGGGASQAVEVDATKEGDMRRMFDGVGKEHGRLHVLHNQVGGPSPIGYEVPEAEFDKAVALNMKSAFYGYSSAYDLLKKAEGKGSIVFTASTSALVGSPFSPLYSMVKSSLISFAKSVALFSAKDSVRANVICPGAVDTPMLSEFHAQVPGVPLDDVQRNFVSSIPLGRPARPEEIAGVAAFLACDDSSFVTGAVIPVDGGMVAR